MFNLPITPIDHMLQHGHYSNKYPLKTLNSRITITTYQRPSPHLTSSIAHIIYSNSPKNIQRSIFLSILYYTLPYLTGLGRTFHAPKKKKRMKEIALGLTTLHPSIHPFYTN